MPALTPTFSLFKLEQRLRQTQENEFLRLSASGNQWWDQMAKVVHTLSEKEVLHWILNDQKLEDLDAAGGRISFDEMTVLTSEVTPRTVGKGHRIKLQQLTDLDGNGVKLTDSWVQQMTAQGAYWPQKAVTALLKGGETGKAYDGQAFFSANHPVHPFDADAGVFSNLLSGSSNYRIDAGVTADVALANLGNVFAHIMGLKMANGEDPRMLRPSKLFVGPKLFPRAVQLSDAKTIAQAAASGGGGADVASMIAALNFGKPVLCPELAGFESDTSYFVGVDAMESSEMGAIAYVEREPFAIRYYSGEGGMAVGMDAVLSRADELEWHMKGRNAACYGHPYMLFKCKAA